MHVDEKRLERDAVAVAASMHPPAFPAEQPVMTSIGPSDFPASWPLHSAVDHQSSKLTGRLWRT